MYLFICILYLIYNVFPWIAPEVGGIIVSSAGPRQGDEEGKEGRGQCSGGRFHWSGASGYASQLRSGTTGESLVKCSSILQALAINGIKWIMGICTSHKLIIYLFG